MIQQLIDLLKAGVRKHGQGVMWTGDIGPQKFSVQLIAKDGIILGGVIKQVVDDMKALDTSAEVVMNKSVSKDPSKPCTGCCIKYPQCAVTISDVKDEQDAKAVTITGETIMPVKESVEAKDNTVNVNVAVEQVRKALEGVGVHIWAIWSEQNKENEPIITADVSFRDWRVKLTMSAKDTIKVTSVKIPASSAKEDYDWIVDLCKNALKTVKVQHDIVNQAQLTEQEMIAAQKRLDIKVLRIQRDAAVALGPSYRTVINSKITGREIARQYMDSLRAWFDAVDDLKREVESFLKLQGLTEQKKQIKVRLVESVRKKEAKPVKIRIAERVKEAVSIPPQQSDDNGKPGAAPVAKANTVTKKHVWRLDSDQLSIVEATAPSNYTVELVQSTTDKKDYNTLIVNALSKEFAQMGYNQDDFSFRFKDILRDVVNTLGGSVYPSNRTDAKGRKIYIIDMTSAEDKPALEARNVVMESLLDTLMGKKPATTARINDDGEVEEYQRVTEGMSSLLDSLAG